MGMNYIKSYKLFENAADYTVGQIISDCEDILLDLNDVGIKSSIGVYPLIGGPNMDDKICDLDKLELNIILKSEKIITISDVVYNETKQRLDLFLSKFDIIRTYSDKRPIYNPNNFNLLYYRLILKYNLWVK